MVHQLESTIDWSAKSPFVNWVTGGLNTHVAHHMFSNICHIHYRKITEIISKTAIEFGVKYENRTFLGAMKTQLVFLKKLGNDVK